MGASTRVGTEEERELRILGVFRYQKAAKVTGVCGSLLGEGPID